MFTPRSDLILKGGQRGGKALSFSTAYDSDSKLLLYMLIVVSPWMVAVSRFSVLKVIVVVAISGEINILWFSVIVGSHSPEPLQNQR